MKGPLLFVAAEPRECVPFLAHWESSKDTDLPVHWARQGVWRGREAIAIANGAGAERARAAVEAVQRTGLTPSAICNIGFCGALDAALAPGDVFVAESVRSGGKMWVTRQPGGPKAAHGVLISSGRIAQTAAEKRELRLLGGNVVEMEAAGVADASEKLSVPFYCVRAVSDLAGEDFANDFNRCLKSDGRFDIRLLLLGTLASPVRRMAELIRLSRRTALASKNLGEFLADCSF